MTILGINAYHGDASAALVVDGQLVAAVEEERFNRIKHSAGFTAQAVRYCLQQAGIKPQEINHVSPAPSLSQDSMKRHSLVEAIV